MNLSKPISHLPTGNLQVVKARVVQSRLNMSPNGNLVLAWRFRPEPVKLSDGSVAQLTFHRQDRNRQPLEMTELFEIKTFITSDVERCLELARSKVKDSKEFTVADTETLAEAELSGATLIAYNFLNDMLKATEFFKKIGKEVIVDPSTYRAMNNDPSLVELPEKFKLDFEELNILHDVESGRLDSLAKVMAAMVGEEVQIMVRLSQDSLHVVSAVYHPQEKVAAVAGLQAAQRALISTSPAPARANIVAKEVPAQRDSFEDAVGDTD